MENTLIFYDLYYESHPKLLGVLAGLADLYLSGSNIKNNLNHAIKVKGNKMCIRM